jgi:hypothetical protein
VHSQHRERQQRQDASTCGKARHPPGL